MAEGWPSLLIESKSDARSPFNNFSPKERQELLDAAQRAGAQAVLASWPPRGKLSFIYPKDWP